MSSIRRRAQRTELPLGDGELLAQEPTKAPGMSRNLVLGLAALWLLAMLAIGLIVSPEAIYGSGGTGVGGTSEFYGQEGPPRKDDLFRPAPWDRDRKRYLDSRLLARYAEPARWPPWYQNHVGATKPENLPKPNPAYSRASLEAMCQAAVNGPSWDPSLPPEAEQSALKLGSERWTAAALGRWVGDVYFGGATGKTFVEVGITDGLTDSSTFYLEKCLGWSGALASGEPPEVERLRATRTDVTVFDANVAQHTEPCVYKNHTNPLARRAIPFQDAYSSTKPYDGKPSALWTTTCLSLPEFVLATGLKEIDYLRFNTPVQATMALTYINLNYDVPAVRLISVPAFDGEPARQMLRNYGYSVTAVLGGSYFYERTTTDPRYDNYYHTNFEKSSERG